jgi:hypothetical protein
MDMKKRDKKTLSSESWRQRWERLSPASPERNRQINESMVRMRRRDAEIQAFLASWDVPDPPGGALIQSNGTVTARQPFYRESQSREDFIAEGNRLLAEQQRPLRITDAGMIEMEGGAPYFCLTFVLVEVAQPENAERKTEPTGNSPEAGVN